VRARAPHATARETQPTRPAAKSWPAEDADKPSDVARFRHHPVADEALGHQAHLIRHPLRQEVRQVLLELAGIVAAVGNRPAKQLRPDGREARTRQRVGPNEVDDVDGQFAGRLIPTQQFDCRDLRDVARVDHRDALAADRHRVDAVVQDDVLDRQIVIDEVRRTQDGGVKAHLFDHPLGAGLHRKMRHVHGALSVHDRQVDHALDARLAGNIERDECLSEFVGCDSVEQEQRAHAAERAAQRVDIDHVALGHGDIGRKVGLRRIADKHAHFGTALDELVDDLAADTAGGTGNEDSHGVTPWVGWDASKVSDPCVIRKML